MVHCAIIRIEWAWSFRLWQYNLTKNLSSYSSVRKPYPSDKGAAPEHISVTNGYLPHAQSPGHLGGIELIILFLLAIHRIYGHAFTHLGILACAKWSQFVAYSGEMQGISFIAGILNPPFEAFGFTVVSGLTEVSEILRFPLSGAMDAGFQ